MVWKGVIIKESLTNDSILKLIKIIKSRRTTLENEKKRGFLTFLYIEIKDEDKNTFVNKAQSLIRGRFYIHIVKENNMIIIYKNKVFEFSSEDFDRLEEARKYGLSIGILREQLPSERLIKNPYG
jgi:predicted ABC-type exoprotein transport system permease subunit